MRRFSLVFGMLCLAVCGGGCRGTNGNFALFSPNSTRVPAPGTKSYGTADNNYYSKPAQPPAGAGSAAPVESSTELAWQPPRPRTGDSVKRAGFTELPDRNGDRATTLSEIPVRVVENSSPASSPPRVRGMNVNEVKPTAGPQRFVEPDDAVEISQLPRVAPASPPTIRPPGSTNLSPPAGPAPLETPAASNLRWRSKS